MFPYNHCKRISTDEIAGGRTDGTGAYPSGIKSDSAGVVSLYAVIGFDNNESTIQKNLQAGELWQVPFIRIHEGGTNNDGPFTAYYHMPEEQN